MDSHIACPAPRSFYEGRRYVVLGLVLGALLAAIFPASAGAIPPDHVYSDSFWGAAAFNRFGEDLPTSDGTDFDNFGATIGYNPAGGPVYNLFYPLPAGVSSGAPVPEPNECDYGAERVSYTSTVWFELHPPWNGMLKLMEKLARLTSGRFCLFVVQPRDSASAVHRGRRGYPLHRFFLRGRGR